MKTGVVKSFSGEYEFLSNFHVNEFTWRNKTFPTGEHAFQYAKGWFIAGTGASQQAHFDAIANAPTPAKAKYAGRSVTINISEWDKQRVQIMREIVHARFQTSATSMVGRLINTGAMLLVEGNDWGDAFWGRCKGIGFNTLGAILMEERGYWIHSDFKGVTSNAI